MHGPDFQPLVNTKEIDYHMEKMQKFTKKQMRLEDQMIHFRWIVNFIAKNKEETPWVVGGQEWPHERLKTHLELRSQILVDTGSRKTMSHY